jgi:hypothetical protein
VSKGLTIPLSLDPRDWISGVRVVERSLGDMGDDLGDVEDAGDTLGRKLKESFGDIEQAADDAADKVERELTDAMRDGAEEGDKLERSFDDNFRDIARESDRQFDKVEADIGEVEEEAANSAKEFGASFRGDPVEALEEVQGYLSEIVTSKLPGMAGAIAAIGGGAVLGLVVAGVEQWREKQERIREYADTYMQVITDGVDGPLQRWNQGYDDLIDKQLAMAVLEEASAAQMADIALLAAARGETVEQYVNNVLTGEISTQEELARIQAERQRIAGEVLALTQDGNTENDHLIPILHAQDASLQAQGEALRANGSFLNENAKGVQLAKGAQDAVTAATDESRENQRLLNRAVALGKQPIDENTRAAEGLTAELGEDVTKQTYVEWKNSDPPTQLTETAWKKIYIDWRDIALPDHLTDKPKP